MHRERSQVHHTSIAADQNFIMDHVDKRVWLADLAGQAGSGAESGSSHYQHQSDTTNLHLRDVREDELDASLSNNPNFDDQTWAFNYIPFPQQYALPNSADDGSQSRKRDHQSAFQETVELPAWIGGPFPDFLPSVPRLADCEVDVRISNPFEDEQDGTALHPTFKRSVWNPSFDPVSNPPAVNAFIKVRWINKKDKRREQPAAQLLHQGSSSTSSEVNPDTYPGPLVTSTVSRLPSGFGAVSNLDKLDHSLFKFYLVAICPGRTVISTDNSYKTEIAPMAERSQLVKHCILSLASTYMLDFDRANSTLKAKANYHQNSAISMLGAQLSRLDIQSPGKEDEVVAALLLLAHNEVVNWEVDRSSESRPKWYRSGKEAERLLNNSDPGQRYSAPVNVQCSRARSQLSHLFCLFNIMSDCVYPLDLQSAKCSFPWLLEGTEREQRKIVGTTGLCSKLMHYYAKITHLSGRLWMRPCSDVYPAVGRELEKQLENFSQWSDLSEGHKTSEALLGSCVLDGNGKVNSAERVTELVAETYVAAAQIYLQCRFFRPQSRPRYHPTVQQILRRLLLCIDYQPTSGPLFTAQTPLFSVFIAGIVAFTEEDRSIVRKWFEPVCSGSRGNVPPAWRAMKYVWGWSDERAVNGVEPGYVLDPEPQLSERYAWWEDLAEALKTKEGKMSLS